MLFKIMGKEGDAAYDYDLDVAEIKFDELKGANLLPVAVKEGRREVLKSFDPEVEQVIWMPKVIGG
jgi:hypothetical protein